MRANKRQSLYQNRTPAAQAKACEKSNDFSRAFSFTIRLQLVNNLCFAVYIGFCGYYNKRVCSFGKFSARLRALS